MKGKKRLLSWILVLSALTSPAAAEPAGSGVLSLDVSTAVEMTLASSEGLCIKDNDVGKALSQHKEAQAALYPKVDLEASWMKNYLYPDLPCTKNTTEYYLSSGVVVSQVVTTFGRISSAIAAAEKGYDISRLQRENVAEELTYAATVVYYNAVFTQHVLDIAQESLYHVRQNEEILQDRSGSGRVSRHDNIKISADIAARVPIVNDAKFKNAAALRTLRTYLRVDDGIPIDFVEGYRQCYPAVDRDRLADLLCQYHPQLKALCCSAYLQDDIIKGRKAEYFPVVSAFANWRHKGGGERCCFGNALDDYGEVGLSARWPIYAGGAKDQRLYQARFDKNNALLALRKAEEDLFLELDKTIIEYEELRQTLPANDEAVSLASESFNQCQELFRSGQLSVTDLNDAELMLTNQKFRREGTLFSMNALLAKMERLTGWRETCHE